MTPTRKRAKMEFEDLVRIINTTGTYLQVAATVWVGTMLTRLIRFNMRGGAYGQSLDVARKAQQIEKEQNEK
jgi:hypothetical protein